jgi:hypothetical protein
MRWWVALGGWGLGLRIGAQLRQGRGSSPLCPYTSSCPPHQPPPRPPPTHPAHQRDAHRRHQRPPRHHRAALLDPQPEPAAENGDARAHAAGGAQPGAAGAELQGGGGGGGGGVASCGARTGPQPRCGCAKPQPATRCELPAPSIPAPPLIRARSSWTASTTWRSPAWRSSTAATCGARPSRLACPRSSCGLRRGWPSTAASARRRRAAR